MGKQMKLGLIIVLLESLAIIVALAAPSKGIRLKTETNANIRGSRFIDRQDYDSYVSSMSESLRITRKGSDPFGNSQDLSVKPAPQVSTLTTNEVKVDTVPLSELVKRIKVGMIAAGTKKIVVGTQSYGEGDNLPMMFKGKVINLVLTEVSPDRLVFRCVQTGEIVTRESKQPQQGITPATGRVLPKGLSSANQTAPIDVGGDESAP